MWQTWMMLVVYSAAMSAVQRHLFCSATCGKCQFTCNNTRCIQLAFRCDGDNDCQDNSDETGCSPAIVPTAAVPYYDHFLLVADSNPPTIRQISTLSNDSVQLIKYNTDGTPTDVAFDWTTQSIYWSCTCYKAIYKYSLTSRTVSRVHYDIRQKAVFDGLTLDMANEKLIYTDSGSGCIGEVSMDGTIQQNIFCDINVKPRAIILDVNNSVVYWTEWQAPGSGIYRSPITNFNRTAVVLGNLVYPYALAIDFNAQLMYWGDAYTHKIERSNLNGTERTVLLAETSASYYAMTLDSTFLYFTDWSSSYVRKMDRNTTETFVERQATFGQARGIAIYNLHEIATSPVTTTVTTTTATTTTAATTTAAAMSTTTDLSTIEPSGPDPQPKPNASSQGTSTDTIIIIVVVVVVVGVIIIVTIITISILLYKCHRARAAKQQKSTVVASPSVVSMVPVYDEIYDEIRDEGGYDKIDKMMKADEESGDNPHTYEGLRKSTATDCADTTAGDEQNEERYVVGPRDTAADSPDVAAYSSFIGERPAASAPDSGHCSIASNGDDVELYSKTIPPRNGDSELLASDLNNVLAVI